ncbi:hypothetical protein N7448_005448 [Penicillium atrosanguineum]|uniref:Uncharacterized protein n=1 Tax=Penicillium atrosanguineum TaxID=1132637 RepID=A0A9W9PNJ4_9EURO|nr:uncharacterized protein N7443_009177 [Penicillium atrosanguineum]KAJ5126136.1 hypothetical protein N7526_008313 [Penicillium atrosanguineum]KAJ5136894.1 hypothetical protein N7448_005448 [Penicillium atrosanguineum]KAJ5293224.1 hypothetical protein N7443_009177 [Penicillium atrosanguineum]KAJ5302740.1 hypothetical protein N7476_009539 [Penicillium atrosanguineum]
MRAGYVLVPITAAIGAMASQPSDSWVFGDSLFYLGPPSGNAHITKATYSILPPATPLNATLSASDEPWVSVWVGTSSTAGSMDANLYQPLFNWAGNQESSGCSAGAKEWCVAASTYTPDGQVGSNYVRVPTKTLVDFEIAVVDDNVVQTVTIQGKVVSKRSDALDASLRYLYSSNECYTGGGSCGELNGYKIHNLAVTLSEADTDFASDMSLDGVSDAGFKSTDGGITWESDYVQVKAIDFDSSADTELND